LNTDRGEFRLVTILTNSRFSLPECSMGVFSLTDKTSAYNTFLCSEDLPHVSPSETLRSWIAKSQARFDNSDGNCLSVIASQAGKRFQWGDYAALSYCWGDVTSTASILVNGVEIQVTRSLLEAL
jgi:hypothetical protein